MMIFLSKIWHRLFLIERPSISLGMFRIAVAVTVGCHVIPSLVVLDDNYLPTAFKTYNTNFFPVDVVRWIQSSSEPMIYAFVGIFMVAWFLFLIGCFSQISCWIMVAACYYFYALNMFHIGTLSWDILLVTLSLMLVTSYPGDYLSVDGWMRRQKIKGLYIRRRPYFIQRLLQLQIGFTFFYTALYKTTGEGNWLTDNPVYYLMLYPGEGVTKYFLLRDILAQHPQVCYVIGIIIVLMEYALMFLLFWKETRVAAIAGGWFFHILLLLTLDVPAIFFFLFPPQLLLFINPRDAVRWISSKR